MRKIIGIVLLVIGLATLGRHGTPADTLSESARMGYIVGQYTVNAMFIGSGLYLLVTKGKPRG